MRHLNRRHFAHPKPGNKNPNATLESAGPCGRLRGNAYQLAEKYASLGRDLALQRESVRAESCLQYAEHYKRLDLSLKRSHTKKTEATRQNQDDAKEVSHAKNLSEVADVSTVSDDLPSFETHLVDESDENEEASSAQLQQESKPKQTRRRTTPRTKKASTKAEAEETPS